MMTRRNINLALALLSFAAGGAYAQQAASQAATMPAETFLLRQRLVPGVYVARQTMEMDQEGQAGDKALPRVRIGQELLTFQVVTEPGVDCAQDVAITLAHLRQRIEAGELVMSYDSQGPPKQQDPNLAAVFGSLRSVTIVVTVSPDGKVTRAGGLEMVWRVLADKAPALEPFLEHIRTSLADGLVQTMFGTTRQLLPSEPVKVGQKWQAGTEFQMPFGGTRPYKANCTLAEVRAEAGTRTAVIRFEGEMEADAEASARIGGTAVTVKKMKFQQTGLLELCLDSGMVLARNIEQTGEMEMSLDGPAGQVSDVKFTQRLKSGYRIEPHEATSDAPPRGALP